MGSSDGPQLDPDRCGVANNDVDWMARSNSLNKHDKGVRRARSTSLPQHKHSINGVKREPSLPAMSQRAAAAATTGNHNDGGQISRVSTLPTHVESDKEKKPARKGWLHTFSSKFHHEPSAASSTNNNNNTYNHAPPSTTTTAAAAAASSANSTSPKIVSPAPQAPQISTPPSVSSPTSSSSPPPAEEERGSLMGKLRRLSRQNTPVPPATPIPELSAENEKPKVVLNKNWHRKRCKVPQLEGVLPKRVSFDRTVLLDDPPQQIPSRHPKPGNISVSASGEVTRNINNNHQSLAPPSSMSSANSGYYLPKNYAATAAIASQTAYDAALRVQNSLKGGAAASLRAKFMLSSSQVAEEEEEEDEWNNKCVHEQGHQHEPGAGVTIDKPTTTTADDRRDSEPKENNNNNTEESSTVENLYTRCCHLREILPIPATLKQVKGKESPLEIIRLMNPRPTLIEILSFGDFLQAVPIHMVILDNACLSDEMVGILFSVLKSSTSLWKLSLKNVVLSDNGWRAMCAFLVENTSLAKLDLSIHIDPKKKQHIKPETNRAHMDWELFVRAIVAKGGLSELMINQCMVPGEQLDLLIQQACKHVVRLGLAMNDLQCEDLQVIREWMDKENNCQGLDLGGNDLSGCWDTVSAIVSHPSIVQLSLNSTCMKNVEKATYLLQAMSQNQIRYLDLSSNPDLFPKFTPVLAEYLPKFKDLRRFHLDSNKLSPDDIVQLSEAFAKCPNLIHVSLLENRQVDVTSCAALTTAVDISSTIYRVEIDPDLLPASIQRRLAHFCLVNMEASVAGKLKDRESLEQALETDRSDFIELGSELAQAVGDILKTNKDDDEIKCRRLAETMVRRGKNIRDWIHERLADLFNMKHNNDGLSTENKEQLIKLVILDSNLEKVLDQYDETIHKQQHLPLPHVSDHVSGIISGSSEATNPQHPDLQVEPISTMDEGELSRKSSSTNLHAKAQEMEEGEIHKFSTFMRQRVEEPKAGDSSPSLTEPKPMAAAEKVTGEQMRRAILTAKGEQNVLSLIERVKQSHGPELERILDTLCNNKEGTINGLADKMDDETLNSVVNDVLNLLSTTTNSN